MLIVPRIVMAVGVVGDLHLSRILPLNTVDLSTTFLASSHDQKSLRDRGARCCTIIMMLFTHNSDHHIMAGLL